MKTDAELIRQARSDPEAFAELYRRHSRTIHAWLRRRAPAEVALELTAETFCEAGLSLGRFRDLSGGSALPWLYGIARNLLFRYLERQLVEARAAKKLGVTTGVIDDGFDEVDERLRSEWLRRDLASALAALPAKQRRAVELRVIDELPYAELAQRLGCSPLAARLRVHRGLARLEQALATQTLKESGTARMINRPGRERGSATNVPCETAGADP